MDESPLSPTNLVATSFSSKAVKLKYFRVLKISAFSSVPPTSIYPIKDPKFELFSGLKI
jgi:hypothetical protein